MFGPRSAFRTASFDPTAVTLPSLTAIADAIENFASTVTMDSRSRGNDRYDLERIRLDNNDFVAD